MIVRDRITISDEVLAEICRRYHVRELALFGSVLREDFGEDSDIDVLVEFEPDARIGFLELAGLQDDLSESLGHNVDLVTKSGLKPLIQGPVLRSAQPFYIAGEGVQIPAMLDAEQSRAAKRVDRDLLHLHTAADACASITEIITSALPMDDIRRSAMLFELFQLGEAIKRLSLALKERHSDAPWQLVSDTGASVIERYYDIDWERVWSVATVAVLTLHDQISAIMAAELPVMEEKQS